MEYTKIFISFIKDGGDANNDVWLGDHCSCKDPITAHDRSQRNRGRPYKML